MQNKEDLCSNTNLLTPSREIFLNLFHKWFQSSIESYEFFNNIDLFIGEI